MWDAVQQSRTFAFVPHCQNFIVTDPTPPVEEDWEEKGKNNELRGQRRECPQIIVKKAALLGRLESNLWFKYMSMPVTPQVI